MKNKTKKAGKARVQKSAGTVPVVALSVAHASSRAEVHVHPGKIEVFRDGKLQDRFPNGADGSDAGNRRIAIVSKGAPVVRRFDVQGNEIAS